MKLILKKFSKNFYILFAVLYFLIGLLTLSDYGINWDTINHLPRGQSYLHYFLTGNKDFTDLPRYQKYYQPVDTLFPASVIQNGDVPAVSIYQDAGVDFSYFVKNDGGHPPLSDILSSVFNLVLFQKLGIVNDIDSYRVYSLLLAATLIGLISWWTNKQFGILASLVAAISLATYPLFWSEMHFNNEKDIPETVYWSFLLFCFWQGINKKSPTWIILSAIFGGLALGTKFNVLFIVFLIIPWLIFFLFLNSKEYLNKNFFYKNKKLIISVLIAPVIVFVIFFASWPYLWNDPIRNISNVLFFYRDIGLTENFDSRYITYFGFSVFPIKWIISTTPIPILILSILGIFFLLKNVFKDKTAFNALIIIWFVLPIIRITWPGTTVYGGIRQIMEYIPALAILSGIGSYFVYSIILNLKILQRSKITMINFFYLVLIIAFSISITNLVKIHPNENVYFNFLIGGLSGAKEKELPFWGNTFGAAYRQGVLWINENSPPNSKIAYARELIPNIPKNWFREDLELHNANRSGHLRKGEYIIALNYQGTENVSYFDRYLKRMLIPVKQFKVDGVPVLNIWINDKKHSIKRFLTDKEIDDFSITSEPQSVIFELPKVYELSRLETNLMTDCDGLEYGYIQISLDGTNWERLPGTMPNEDWSVPQYKGQPNGQELYIAFAADKAKYIQIVSSPKNSCLSMVEKTKIYYFE